MKYKRKPTEPEEVEVKQWLSSSAQELYTLSKFFDKDERWHYFPRTDTIEIYSDWNKPIILVKLNDYILKHQDGTFSVCKPEEFEKKWEEI